MTLALLIGYLFWEIGIWVWARKLPPHDPIIRVDLIIIYPLLLLFLSVSAFQFLKSNSSKKTMKSILPLFVLFFFLIACKQEKSAPEPNQITTKKEMSNEDIENTNTIQKSIFTTSTGKSIELIAYKKSNSLNDLKVIALDFSNTKDTFSITDSDPLQHAWIKDLDNNGYDEIYLITTSSGSGSYANIYGYASNQDLSISPIYVPEITENDLLPEGAYYGYMGHDSIYVDNNKIYRKYPIYKEGDANCCPSGENKVVGYELQQGEASWILRIEN